MRFDSWQAFIDMGGYGYFVWLSYGSGLLLLIALIAMSLNGHKQTKRNIAQKINREQKLKQAAELAKKQNSEVVNESTS